jgi:uncharacterized membrane protein YraQ (UPF0718 family)
MYDKVVDTIIGSWLVAGQMAPYLLFGFLAAGALSVWVSAQWVERHLGGRGWGPIFKASLFGVPLPLCSCSVIPVTASIRRHGASRGAASAFLLSTPQTGVDSIAVTYALLGPVFAVFRAAAALATGLIGGMIIQLFGAPNGRDDDETAATECAEACCAEGGGNSVRRALRYGFVTLPRDIGLALLIGIAIAGAMTAVVPQDYLAAYIGGGVLSILAMMAVGAPIYVCATASVPIAAGFMHMGASPGAALAFLIAGPATNAATFTTVWKMLGRRSAILYLAIVAAAAVGCGLLLNGLIGALDVGMPQLGAQAHEHQGSSWALHAWTVALLAVMAFSYWSASRPEE